MTGGGVPTIHVASVDEIAPRTLYALIQLRVQVFTVEQDVAYQDLDGKDLEPGALQLWQQDGARVVSTLRVLERGQDRIIGRVATDADYRGRGLSGQLIRRALELCDGHAIDISAQAHLQQWYERFGFVAHGDGYLEDGIPHVAMRRQVAAT